MYIDRSEDWGEKQNNAWIYSIFIFSQPFHGFFCYKKPLKTRESKYKNIKKQCRFARVQTILDIKGRAQPQNIRSWYILI